MLTRQISDVLNGGAEACRAHHRAVAARQTTPGDLVPARVLVIAVEQVLDVGHVELAAHLRGSARVNGGGGGALTVARPGVRHVRQHFRAAVGPDLDHEVVPRPVEHLGQG